MRTPRPYIKSSMKLDLHLTENVGREAEKVLMDLLHLLSINGFQRANTKQERRKMALGCDSSKSVDRKENCASTFEGTTAKKLEDKQKRSDFGVIGLRSLLKLLNKSSNVGVLIESSPSVVLIDSNILKPTAVAHLIALVALGKTELCPFYVIPNLSEMMSKQLNISRVSAIGLSATAVDRLPTLKTTFHQIEISPKVANTNISSSSAFVTPTLRVPKGKSGEKKKMNSKKKKKEKQRLARKN